MRKLKNFIGDLLIGLAAFITFLRNAMFFVLVIGLVMGILMVTMIAFFELVGRVTPPDPRYGEMQINLFKHWYWDLIIVFIGGATMWQGVTKMFESDKKESKKFEKNMANK